jgi:RNase adapter protein RapZ
MNKRIPMAPTSTEGRGGGLSRIAPCAVRVLLVTGMSGAGKTSALKSLEDMGYEAIDNVPLSLLGRLVAPGESGASAHSPRRPMAIGMDIRTRDFGVEPFMHELYHLIADSDVKVEVLFMDCDDEELCRRYVETRHRHPLAQDRPVIDGITHERRLVSVLRDRADLVLDTTASGPGALKHILEGHFGVDRDQGLTIFVTSFSYRRGVPREADLVFDVRFLANPHYDPALRALSGCDPAVAQFIADDEDFARFFDSLTVLLLPLLPRYSAEGKSYLTIAVGCTGGRHRSVFVAERLAAWLKAEGQKVRLHHRALAKTETQRNDIRDPGESN